MTKTLNSNPKKIECPEIQTHKNRMTQDAMFTGLSSFGNLDEGQKLRHLQKGYFLICGGHFCLEITT